MADLDERLNQLISDQESMKKVLAMAKAILAQRDSANSEPAAPIPAPPTTAATGENTSDVAAMLAAMMAKNTENSSADPPAAEGTPVFPTTGSEGSLSPLAAMLPQLMQIFSGNGNLIKSERVNLLQAMRPYLKESRMSSIDRALKMANATKAATSAMHLLGR